MIEGKIYEISVKSDKRNRKVKMKFIEELNNEIPPLLLKFSSLLDVINFRVVFFTFALR